ncbi:MAG: cytochrome P450 [Oligoflexus sp.]
MTSQFQELSRRNVVKFLLGTTSAFYFGCKSSADSAKLAGVEDPIPPPDPTQIPGRSGPDESKAAMEGGGYAWSRQRAMEFGEVCRTTYGAEDAVLLTGESGMRAFYNSDFVSREQAKTEADLAFLSDGKTQVVPAMDGSAFVERKANLMKLVSSQAFELYIPQVNAVMAEYVRRWSEKGECDLRLESPQMAFLALSTIITGAPGRAEHGRAYNESILGFRGMDPAGKLKFRDQLLAWYRESLTVQRKNTAEQAKSNMIGILAHQTKLTDDEIIAETQHLFIGSAGVWIISLTALALLSQFPDLMKQAREELAQISEVPTLEQLRQAKFLQALIEEVARWTPIINAQTGRALKDFSVNGYIIPKGTLLVAGLYATNSQPKLFPEPDRFNVRRPETIGQDKGDKTCPMSKCSPYGFVAFGGGEDRRTQHRCLGEELLSLSVKLFLAQALRHNDWSMINADEVKLAPTPYMAPRMLMKLSKRV